MKRVVLLVADANERALIAAQLQEELSCAVASAADLDDALALLIVRATLVTIDLRGLDVERWEKLRAVARGAPLLVLASRTDRATVARLGFGQVMYRPFTVGDVVVRAREMLKEKSQDD
jgi:DNA-binding response OmpR family regulator